MGKALNEDYNLYNDETFINETDYSYKHLRSIRYQLWLGRKAYHEREGRSALGIRKTLDWLEKTCHITLSEQTFASLYDPISERRVIDLAAVIKLCELWELDPLKVLALPDDTTLRKSKKIDEGWHILTDQRYAGRFHCYFFKITGNDPFMQDYQYTLRKKEDLVRGTLDIKLIGDDKASATFEYTNTTSNDEAKYKFATCTPMVSKLGNVYFDFVDNDGRVYKICFNYRDFPSSGDCYFRIASMLTEGSDQVHYPLFQKMVLFREEPDETYLDHIRGLLNHSDENILIMPEMLEELSEDPLIKKFADSFCLKTETPQPKRTFYHLNENMIMNTLSPMSSFEAKSALMKIRHYAFSPNQSFIGNDPDIHRIANDIQKRSKKSNSTN